MADPGSPPPGHCQKCGIDGDELKRCSRCKAVRYCSRDCQKADWKQHKKRCVDVSQSGESSNSNSGTQSTSALSVSVEKPFHKLHDKTWLHGRPVEDVYKLLIDVYRLRLEDEYTFTGDVDASSVYGGATDGGRNGFRRFLRLVAKRPGLLPTWWTREKGDECIEYGMSRDTWSCLGAAVEKSDVIEHYGDPLMPMQLRMFGEEVYRKTPWGHSSGPMMELQMAVERGDMREMSK